MRDLEAERSYASGLAPPTAVLRPPDGVPAAASMESSAKRLASRPLPLLLAACLLFVAGAVVGVVVSAAPRDAATAPGLRPASVEEIAAIAGNETPQAGSVDDGSQAAESPDASPPAGEAPASDSDGSAEAATSTPVEESTEQGAASAAEPDRSLVVIPEPFVEVAEALTPSVVRIEVFSDSEQGPSALFGLGSGIVWNAAAGHIVTNEHVVEGVAEVSVILSDGTRLEGEVLGGSCEHDVAVVRVDSQAAELVEAVFAPVSEVRVGQLVAAIGSPFDLTGTVTAGIVSAVRIEVLQGEPALGAPRCPAVPIEMIQTDAAINRGNSGGALADSQGRVIGMNSTILTPSGASAGVGFAIPSDTVELIAERIVAGESLELGYLGITGQAEDGASGVLVVGVVEGSPAAEAGLAEGDVIVSLGGEPMMDIAELSAAIKLLRPGDIAELVIRRDGELLVATVELGALG
ncbi:MAG: trypsin-like peptidase domain-containing protein [Acidimicrobiaceae bacterium]|nr:trypsin-like peptidase domain-containing protein [Acidimicrobiaceae bacterium]MCY4176704.1 trypsin-like peptidase domain-containing protein [Acidimicrobiaceae bacterium]MCY4281190.1 trypsin-like peptidase domain-containing protein [Acidimicrobiaceae bacterium]MCY4294249.1 trypsin-like peptidase domain-containing protein [Acidimicrobiaceae bacterium]